MSTTTDTLLNTALPGRDRARLAKELIASLDGPPEDGAEQAWAAEIERRAAEVDLGAVKLLDWESVRGQTRKKSRKR